MPTAKQIGDACEMLVAARLTIAGNPTIVMPDGWPGYDLIAQRPDRKLQQISVKARSHWSREGSTHSFHFSPDDCDWIAFVFLPDAGGEQIWIVPADVARERSLPAAIGSDCRWPSWRKSSQPGKTILPFSIIRPTATDHMSSAS